MNTFAKKLKLVAAIVARQKPVLRFFGLVERDDLANRWDLLVCSDQLEPRSMDALRYMATVLKKKLTKDEMVQIARVVVLPRENEVISSLIEGQAQNGELAYIPPADRFERAIVLWSENDAVPAK